MAADSIKVPVPKPFTREPIPAPRVEPDRKKKHPRQEKHKKLPVAE